MQIDADEHAARAFGVEWGRVEMTTSYALSFSIALTSDTTTSTLNTYSLPHFPVHVHLQ